MENFGGDMKKKGFERLEARPDVAKIVALCVRASAEGDQDYLP